MLAAEYLRWTNDRVLAERLLPAVDLALDWIATFGDRDGDGFIEYERQTPNGLANQGWKDSWDGIRYGDGRVAGAPIALCEAQAYVYGAYRARAYLASVFDDHQAAAVWSRRAGELATAFDAAFWIEERGVYCVGLDADKKPIDSITSNIGHCLWAGIVPPSRSEQLAEALTDPALFSGWGLRTLDAANPAYNPLSYHCGSVWPHDTALAIAGLRRYGHHAAASRLQTGLLDAASVFNGRLPELFGGFSRDNLPMPVAYPASCSPQAWAAASPLLMVRSLLGLEPDLPNGVVGVAEAPGSAPRHLNARGVPLGAGRIDVRCTGSTVEVEGLPPGVSLERRS
jgi:glycogen debranching enzyme